MQIRQGYNDYVCTQEIYKREVFNGQWLTLCLHHLEIMDCTWGQGDQIDKSLIFNAMLRSPQYVVEMIENPAPHAPCTLLPNAPLPGRISHEACEQYRAQHKMRRTWRSQALDDYHIKVANVSTLALSSRDHRLSSKRYPMVLRLTNRHSFRYSQRPVLTSGSYSTPHLDLDRSSCQHNYLLARLYISQRFHLGLSICLAIYL